MKHLLDANPWLVCPFWTSRVGPYANARSKAQKKRRPDGLLFLRLSSVANGELDLPDSVSPPDKKWQEIGD